MGGRPRIGGSIDRKGVALTAPDLRPAKRIVEIESVLPIDVFFLGDCH